MATSTIFNFNFNNSEIVDSTGQWYDATTGTPTTEFINHDGNTALLQRAYVAGTAYTRDINPVFFQSRDPTFTAHTYTIELQIYPLKDPGGANFGPETGPVLDFNPAEADEENRVQLRTMQTIQYGSKSNTFYWHEYGLGPDGTGIPFLTVTAADGTYNRWYSIRIERVDDGTNTGATIKIYVDGTLVVNETLTYSQDARRGRIGDSIRYTYRRSSIDPQGAGVAIDNFKLTAGIAPSSVVDVSLANLQRNNANLLNFIKGKVSASVVNDGTLTIQQNGTNVATFTANQSTAATANITVPTAVSELTNDSGYLTSSSNLDASKLTSGTVDIARLPQGALERLVKVANEAARYALTIADVQLGDTVQQLDTGIMYIVTDADHLDSAAGYTEYTAGTAASVPWSGVTGKPTFAAVATSGAYSDLTGKPTFAAVATSGAYSDLTGTPTIPTVNNATLTIQQNGTTVDTFSANSSSDKTVNITVPTATSELTNDSGFITEDTTKIPLSGSNAISGSLIPATDNSIDIGSSTKNIKMLHTKGITIDGTQFLPSDYMTLNTVQTVTSTKNYSGVQNIDAYRLHIKSPNQEKGVIPASNQWNGFSFNDKNDVQMFAIEQGVLIDGTVQLKFSGRANDNDATYTAFLRYVTNSDLTVNCVNIIDLIPFGNGTRKLGDTNAKWKSLNGINPGALSLPNPAYISLDTTNFDVTAIIIGTFTPTVDGWAILSMSQRNKHFGIWILNGSYRVTFHSVYHQGGYMMFALMPVRANVTMTVYCTADDIDSTRKIDWLRLFPCQGNV